jgi:hypothetical protein
MKVRERWAFGRRSQGSIVSVRLHVPQIFRAECCRRVWAISSPIANTRTPSLCLYGLHESAATEPLAACWKRRRWDLEDKYGRVGHVWSRSMKAFEILFAMVLLKGFVSGSTISSPEDAISAVMLETVADLLPSICERLVQLPSWTTVSKRNKPLPRPWPESIGRLLDSGEHVNFVHGLLLGVTSVLH